MNTPVISAKEAAEMSKRNDIQLDGIISAGKSIIMRSIKKKIDKGERTVITVWTPREYSEDHYPRSLNLVWKNWLESLGYTVEDLKMNFELSQNASSFRSVLTSPSPLLVSKVLYVDSKQPSPYEKSVFAFKISW